MIQPCELCGEKAAKPTLVCSTCVELAEERVQVPKQCGDPRALKTALVGGPVVHDPVNSLAHYRRNGYEAIEVIEAFAANNYLRASALKYLLRAGSKADLVEDLRKAEWFIKREIAKAGGAQ